MYSNGEEHLVGDLVKVVKGFWDHCSDDVGKIAVIEHTHATEYGGDNHNSLYLRFSDGKGSGWWYPEKLELVTRDASGLADLWAKQKPKVNTGKGVPLILDQLEVVIADYQSKLNLLLLVKDFKDSELPKTRENLIDFLRGV